ncbi:hypothetical protein QFZ52_000423 [Arthrobacter woluwensis]|nr:hypothetical protein [Arthrobacter woluwensis]
MNTADLDPVVSAEALGLPAGKATFPPHPKGP